MTIKIVNSAPGDVTEPASPTVPLQLGIRSDTHTVDPTSIIYDVAFSSLRNSTPVFPDVDPLLLGKGPTITFDTVESVRPTTGAATRSVLGDDLVLTRNSSSSGQQSVFNIRYPIADNRSCLAYYKFRKKPWTLVASPNFVNSNNVVAPYLGLEFGPLNTGAFVFFRDNGVNGSVLLGGPQNAPNGTRTGLSETSLHWKLAATDEFIEVYIFFNLYAQLGPSVELWIKLPDFSDAQLVASILIASLGTFPTISGSGATNYRSGPSKFCSLYWGNAGANTDIFQLAKWTLYPDYRLPINFGLSTSDNDRFILPDSPGSYTSANKKTPKTMIPGRWLEAGTLNPSPTSTLIYPPSIRSTPLYLTISKTVDGTTGWYKNEPKLEERVSGCVVEGAISAHPKSLQGVSTGMGIGIEDGLKSVMAALITDNFGRNTIGLLANNSAPDALASYYTPTAFYDHKSLRFVRVVMDRYRSQVLLFVENEDYPVLTLPLTTTSFPTSPQGKVSFGHLVGSTAKGDFNIAFANYLQAYKAWEGSDNLLPNNVGINASIRFSNVTSGTASSSISGGVLTIVKTSFNTLGSKNLYSLAQGITATSGVQVDFRNQISRYTDSAGTIFAPISATGVGVHVFTGTSKLRIGLYNCGIHGRMLGIVPGSGTVTDILNQTPLGRRFSCKTDWTVATTYRVVVKPYDSIKVWVGSVRNAPSITIPWEGDDLGFDLPADVTPASLEFGHLDSDTSSTSKWEFVRWGISNGFDIGGLAHYPEGYGPHLFGGSVIASVVATDS